MQQQASASGSTAIGVSDGVLRIGDVSVPVRTGGAAHLVPEPGREATQASEGWSVEGVNRLQGAIVRTHLNNLHSIPQGPPPRVLLGANFRS